MKKVLYLLLCALLLPVLCCAQAYRHIGIENNLSSRKVYAIQKDKTGYMWFLTHEGIDRYNGKDIKHYTLEFENNEISSLQDLNWLYTDSEGHLWEIGKRGRIFGYNPVRNQFELVYNLADKYDNGKITPISYSFVDSDDLIWLCGNDSVFVFNPATNQASGFDIDIPGSITYAIPFEKKQYFIGTNTGAYIAAWEGDALELKPIPSPLNLPIHINSLYYDTPSNLLFIGTFQRGLYVYNARTGKYTGSSENLFPDMTITCIKPVNENELLVATDGTGIYKLNTQNNNATPYMVADYNHNTTITGNNILDIYIDSEERVWIANYPVGVTIRDDRYSQYSWHTHSTESKQSLVNNRVNSIIEDSEGCLWFATNGGVSLYNPKNKTWQSFLHTMNEKNRVYLSICEVEPRVFYVGGYTSTIYKIDARNMPPRISKLDLFSSTATTPDKYIRSIIKDSKGDIWVGGLYNLRKLQPDENKITSYPGLSEITVLLEKDKDHLWVGSSTGLHLLNKKTGEYEHIDLPSPTSYIYSLYQTGDNKLYIGTNGSGFLIYNLTDASFTHYHRTNSPLISDNIYTILGHDSDKIVLSSESGLTRFLPAGGDFHNWTKEQGLVTTHFNPSSGVASRSGNLLFGSTEGVIEFHKDIQLPLTHSSKMVFGEFGLFYEPSYPGMPQSPLKNGINDTESIVLKYDQNIFSMRVSSINYDYPSNMLYSWKLEGFYDTWSAPSAENLIRFTNLDPGKYKLMVRSISNESRKVIEERSISIIIKSPYWRSFWAIVFYLGLFFTATVFVVRLITLRKEKKVSEDKFQFFINTAHDIRTPLTLVKAPLEEMGNTETFTSEGQRNMNTAMRNVNVLLRLTNNLINFEHTDIYSSKLFIAEYELNTLMNEIIKSFHTYASTKEIDFVYKSNFKFLNVWFDREKMDSIIRNVISNALKYTPTKGRVEVYATESAGHWSVEVRDTGIGIPASEKKRIFKDHFRGTNAINSKVTGTGMGMVLVGRLVKLHKGKIALRSVENQGTTIRISFPKGYNHFKQAHLASAFNKNTTVSEEFNIIPVLEQAPLQINRQGRKILVVEDNDELRNYLTQTLSSEYYIQTCENGKDALQIVKEYMPELIISDIMMPEMRGDEMCEILKKDIDTSHIPVILLTALNDERSILKGIQTGADEYIVKPFNIGILKATIANLLANRAILRNKFAAVDLERNEEEEACLNCTTDLDWKFMANLRTAVEENMTTPDFTVDTLSSLMNMSRTSLYNKIKVLTDTSPSDYIRLIRLKKAAELLKEGTYSVTEVADMTGFNDAKYFREVFKKHFNVSPSKYKEE